MDLLGRMTSRKSPVHKYCMDTTSKPGPSVEPFGTRKIMMGVPSGKYDTVFALNGGWGRCKNGVTESLMCSAS